MSTTTISFNLRVNGDLRDPTSVVLSDPTATFGVRRIDTGETVVAADTAFVHDGTGRYSYTFDDPALGLIYEAQIKYVLNGNTYYDQKFATGSNGGYGLADLQKMVRYNARNAKDSTEYPDEQIDLALIRAGREWVRTTKATKTLSSLTLTAGSNVLPSTPDGFLPEFLTRAYLTLNGTPVYPELNVVSYEDLLQKQYCRGTAIPPSTGRPSLLAFYNRVNGVVGPLLPDQAYVVNLVWYQPFTTWTAGADPSTVTSFNLPDDHLEMIAMGAAGFIQLTEPENAAAAQTRVAEFRMAAKQFAGRGSGGDGPQVIERTPPEWMRGGGCR